ncbi:MATE family efflux transporter [Streptococcus sp. sy018]|nr:MATE family efflux transporter [Streptococcus sp. sy018]
MRTIQKRLLTIALPVVLENFLQAALGLVDGYLVAQIGLVAISGVAVANQIMTLYQAVFMALVGVFSGLLAQAKGQHQSNKEDDLIRQGVMLTLILGLFFGLLSVFAGDALLGLLGTISEVKQLGRTYLFYVGGSSVLLGLNLTLSAIARVRGLVNFPLWVSFLTNLINLFLSSWAIFGLKQGVIGVALATMLARMLGLVLMLRKLDLTLNWQFCKPVITRQLLSQFLPALAERLMMRFGDVVTLAMITSFGTKTLAASSLGETLSQFNYLPALGLSTAVLILVAEENQNKQNQSDYLKQAYFLAAAAMLVMSGSIYVFGNFLLGLFTQNRQVLTEGKIVLLYSFLGSPITAGVLVLTGFWQALRQSQLPFYATSIGMWLIRIGLGYLFIYHYGLGLTGLWLATLLDNFWRLAYLLFYYRYRFMKT